MSEYVRKSKESRRQISDEEAKELQEQAAVDAGKTAVKPAVDNEAIDAILNEIDDLLKENDAATFVRGFVQQGGQ